MLTNFSVDPLRKDFESFDVFDVVDQRGSHSARNAAGTQIGKGSFSTRRVRGSRIAAHRQSGTRNPEPVLGLLARRRIHLVPTAREPSGLVSLLKETHRKPLQAAIWSRRPNRPNR